MKNSVKFFTEYHFDCIDGVFFPLFPSMVVFLDIVAIVSLSNRCCFTLSVKLMYY